MQSIKSSGEIKVYTVSEITSVIKDLIVRSFPKVWVQGEVSNLRFSNSGHCYFDLKDQQAILKCVLFKDAASRQTEIPKNGDQIMVFGKLTVYDREGVYELNVEQILSAGVGNLHLAFLALKQKLAKEGLFDPDRKKPLPHFPRSIAVITSPTGAAIRDVIRMTKAICLCVRLVLVPVRVQGEGAGLEIAQAIELVNKIGGLDVILLTRGGGSIEDLWAFNEEVVARAIAKSAIPVVSAVGHETDYTIADMVADIRAPTPSSAPGLILRDYVEARQEVSSMLSRARASVVNILKRHETILDKATTRYALMRIEDMLFQNTRTLDQIASSAIRAINGLFERKMADLDLLCSKLEALSPEATLKRGFSICFRLPDMMIVREAGDLDPGMRIATRFYRGMVQSVVEEVDKGK